MAERAKGRKRGGKGNGSAKPRAAKAGDNSGHVPSEVVNRHWGHVGAALKNVKRTADAAKKARSALSNCYRAAKSDGIDVDEMKAARGLHDGDHMQAASHYAGVARILDAVESPVAQLNLFTRELPPPVNAYLRGQQAGREAVDAGANPFTPGSQEFESWAEGWTSGQEQNLDKFRGGDGDAASAME